MGLVPVKVKKTLIIYLGNLIDDQVISVVNIKFQEVELSEHKGYQWFTWKSGLKIHPHIDDIIEAAAKHLKLQ
jgi:hypothetical protein